MAVRTSRVKHAAWNAWPHLAARAYRPGVYGSRQIQHSPVGSGHSEVTRLRRETWSALDFRWGVGCLFATLRINIAQKNTVLVDPGSIFGGSFAKKWRNGFGFGFGFVFISKIGFPSFSRWNHFFYFVIVLRASPLIFGRYERLDGRVCAELKQRVHLRVHRRAELHEPREPGIVQRVHPSYFIFLRDRFQGFFGGGVCAAFSSHAPS